MILNTKELREKTRKELEELLNKAHKDVSDSVEGVLSGQEKNLGKPRMLRKNIARIQTVLTEMEVENA